MILFSVHCGFRQDLFHARALLLCGLLHHPALFRLHLLGQDLDRLQIPPRHAAHVRPRHPPVPQHPQNHHFDQVLDCLLCSCFSPFSSQACSTPRPLCLSLAHWRWSCSFGELETKTKLVDVHFLFLSWKTLATFPCSPAPKPSLTGTLFTSSWSPCPLVIMFQRKIHLKPFVSVGYGDITCTTEVGRVFQLMFLAVGLVILPKISSE